MTTRGAVCALTRACAFHATHQYNAGGPTIPHGHLYRVEATVARRLAPGESAVIDLAVLDQILTEQVTDVFDGHHVNDVATFTGEPTCEAIAIWCWERISPRLPSTVQLQRIRVAEDGFLWADCTGAD